MAPTEVKVKASTSAAAVSGLALWALSTYVFKGQVPDVLQSWIYFAVPGILAWASGYWAPHTHRPDLPPGPVLVPVVPLIPPATRNNPGERPVPVTEEGGTQVPPV